MLFTKRKFDNGKTMKIILWIIAVAAVIGYCFAPAAGPYYLRLLSLSLIYLILTSGLNLIAGYTGQVSLGQAGLYGIGAYTGGILASSLGWSFWLCLPAAMVVGGIFGVLLGLPTLRVSGHYLALVTIGFGVIVEKVLVEWDNFTGGPAGIYLPQVTMFGTPLSETMFFYMLLVICLIVILITSNIMHSPYGNAFSAIKGNETAASCMGIGVAKNKLLAFVLSAVFAGLAGCLYAFYSSYISPDTFVFDLSVFFLLTIIVGGQGTLTGPIIGTILLTIFPEFLTYIDKYRLVLYGALLVAVVIFLPDGITGIIRRKFPNLITFNRPKEICDDPVGATHAESRGGEMLALTEVSKEFGGLKAIDSVTLTVDKGSVHSLIGPNGAGKTTLINLITGVYAPDQGQIYFGNKQLSGKAPHQIARMGIARTFQTVQLFKNLTVFENILVGTHRRNKVSLFEVILRTKKTRKSADYFYVKTWDLLKLVGLEDRANSFADSLSAGQQRFLEVARALALNPKLLILDEPAAGLNSAEIDSLGQIIKQITNEGISIFLIEHHMEFVMNISDKVSVLNSGRIIAEGSPEEVQTNPEVIEAYLGKKVVDEPC